MVQRFLAPGLRPGLPLANGRPRVAEIWGVSGPLDRRIANDR